LTPFGKLMCILLGAGAALSLVGSATAAPPAATKTASMGVAGMWILEGKDFGRELKLPLTPAGQAIVDARRKAINAGDVIGDKVCAPHGMPSMMANEFALEFMVSPDRVIILNEEATLPRNIYLDEKTHTTGLEPSWNGHSIGHWEGEGPNKILVIDTVNFNDKAQPFGFIGVRSSTTHLVERYQVSADGQHMTGTFTFEDPRYLIKPWTGEVHYRRLPPHSEFWEYACEVGGGWQERFKGDPAANAPPK
jgi:hypothetical protein